MFLWKVCVDKIVWVLRRWDVSHVAKILLSMLIKRTLLFWPPYLFTGSVSVGEWWVYSVILAVLIKSCNKRS